MTTDELAVDLVKTAIAEQQVARRIDLDVDLDELRRLVREEARERQVKIRTAVMDDRVLAVVRLDADIWHESTATMRAKLTPT